jgi:hypothetical protein
MLVAELIERLGHLPPCAKVFVYPKSLAERHHANPGPVEPGGYLEALQVLWVHSDQAETIDQAKTVLLYAQETDADPMFPG